jgi:hypothetical protein
MKVFNPLQFNPNDKFFVTFKIDGVQAIRKNGSWTSRAGKPLYNLPDAPDGRYEVFLGDFKSSISAVKTHNGSLINSRYLYRLDEIDSRLVAGIVPRDHLSDAFKHARNLGYEGLVVHIGCGNGEWFKIKDKITLDVKLIDIIEGTGRNKGRMGALLVKTKDGITFKVGTGFTDEDREMFWNWGKGHSIIEVEGMELLPSGKLRHPRFVRIREDLA